MAGHPQVNQPVLLGRTRAAHLKNVPIQGELHAPDAVTPQPRPDPPDERHEHFRAGRQAHHQFATGSPTSTLRILRDFPARGLLDSIDIQAEQFSAQPTGKLGQFLGISIWSCLQLNRQIA